MIAQVGKKEGGKEPPRCAQCMPHQPRRKPERGGRERERKRRKVREREREDSVVGGKKGHTSSFFKWWLVEPARSSRVEARVENKSLWKRKGREQASHV